MKEKDCKKLRCCGPCPENTGTSNKDARCQASGVGEHMELRYYCSGSQCAAWVKALKMASNKKRQDDGFPVFEDIEEGRCGFKEGRQC